MRVPPLERQLDAQHLAIERRGCEALHTASKHGSAWQHARRDASARNRLPSLLLLLQLMLLPCLNELRRHHAQQVGACSHQRAEQTPASSTGTAPASSSLLHDSCSHSTRACGVSQARDLCKRVFGAAGAAHDVLVLKHLHLQVAAGRRQLLASAVATVAVRHYCLLAPDCELGCCCCLHSHCQQQHLQLRTLSPCRASSRAETSPLCPAPTITTSALREPCELA